VQDCDDGDPCTQNACNGASCTYPPENDGAECAPDKVCKSGSCILACDDDFEPNNNCGAASSISQGNHTNLVMAYPNDDYYKINVGNGKTLDVGIFNATPGYFWQLYLHTENCGGMALDYWESSNSTIGSVSWTNSTGGTVAARIWAGANDMSCDLTYDLTVGVF
jgi:hypothetical protein